MALKLESQQEKKTLLDLRPSELAEVMKSPELPVLVGGIVQRIGESGDIIVLGDQIHFSPSTEIAKSIEIRVIQPGELFRFV